MVKAVAEMFQFSGNQFIVSVVLSLGFCLVVVHELVEHLGRSHSGISLDISTNIDSRL